MASQTDIYNLALQKLGAGRVTSTDQNSPNARSCSACYTMLRDAELRLHPWNFANGRASLAADAEAPAFGKSYSYTLPADFLCLRENDDETNDKDWVVEGNKIFTNWGAPLEIRYTKRIEDTALMDPLFVESLASKMAVQMCEEITQSNSKKADARDDYKTAIANAKRINAIERRALIPQEDTWVTVRNE